MIDLIRQAEIRKSIELFYFAYRAFTSQPDQILEQRGLGRVHHRILYFIGQNPDITVNVLLKILSVSKQALNIPLRQLIGMKLVSIRKASHDGRFKQLHLTEEGEKLESQLTATQINRLENVFGKKGREEEIEWQKIMSEIADTDK
ncbi:MAG: MarR family winged helix-turn-helix transcriptional regulator [Leptospirillum sp.]